jgi:hypothetical protein
VKYDKFYTKNVYVDGIKNCNLKLEGDNAYGKRWVTLDKVSDISHSDEEEGKMSVFSGKL